MVNSHQQISERHFCPYILFIELPFEKVMGIFVTEWCTFGKYIAIQENNVLQDILQYLFHHVFKWQQKSYNIALYAFNIYICNGHNANNAVLTTAHSSCSCARAIHKLLPAWKQKYKYVVHGTDISTLSAAFCISDNHDLIVLSGFVDFDVNYCEETGINANKALIDPY